MFEDLLFSEEDRLDSLAELEENIPNIKKDVDSGKYYDEIMDRLYIQMSSFENYIFEHPVSICDQETYHVCNRILSDMNDLYQKLGNKL